jgi:hypothetical protein
VPSAMLSDITAEQFHARVGSRARCDRVEGKGAIKVRKVIGTQCTKLNIFLTDLVKFWDMRFGASE